MWTLNRMGDLKKKKKSLFIENESFWPIANMKRLQIITTIDGLCSHVQKVIIETEWKKKSIFLIKLFYLRVSVLKGKFVHSLKRKQKQKNRLYDQNVIYIIFMYLNKRFMFFYCFGIKVKLGEIWVSIGRRHFSFRCNVLIGALLRKQRNGVFFLCEWYQKHAWQQLKISLFCCHSRC